jgi:alkanesulfonate monooxygenase SsuD/methylene tetrahydromethanopterin reductase-like flavin-dependent oxidoreductase (luciferase family)
MKLGRLGVWYGTDKLDGSQLRDFVQTVENNGYSTLWYPESRGYESMSLAAWLLSSSEKLVIGSSIANIYARDSFTAQRAMVSLNALYGGRFVLGLGVSHIPMVEGLRGLRQTVGGDGRLSRWHQQVRACRRTAAGRGRSTRAEDAGAERCQVAWRCPIQRDAEAYGRGRRDPRAFEVARGGAEGNA